MVFNNDWLLRQIRGIANMIGKVFKLETILIERITSITISNVIATIDATLPFQISLSITFYQLKFLRLS